MTRWEDFEKYLNTLPPGTSFTVYDYAGTYGISTITASEDIQAYKNAQRAKNSRTKYVLKRMPGTRTKAARWSVGETARDVRLRGRSFSSDVHQQAFDAFAPDLNRIGQINPAAAKRAERIIKATLDGAMKVLEAAVEA